MDKDLTKYISTTITKTVLIKNHKNYCEIYVGPPGFEPESMAPKATSIPG